MNIQLILGQSKLLITLGNGAAARDFQSLLPLKLNLCDYASSEKIADLPRKITTSGEPIGYQPFAGDVCYYAPWGNLALFYRAAPFARGLVYLGRLESAAEALAKFSSRDAMIVAV